MGPYRSEFGDRPSGQGPPSPSRIVPPFYLCPPLPNKLPRAPHPYAFSVPWARIDGFGAFSIALTVS